MIASRKNKVKYRRVINKFSLYKEFTSDRLRHRAVGVNIKARRGELSNAPANNKQKIGGT